MIDISCLGCKRSRVQISAARPNSSKSCRRRFHLDRRFGVQLESKCDTGASLPAPTKNTAPIRGTSLILGNAFGVHESSAKGLSIPTRLIPYGILRNDLSAKALNQDRIDRLRAAR